MKYKVNQNGEEQHYFQIQLAKIVEKSKPWLVNFNLNCNKLNDQQIEHYIWSNKWWICD